MYIPDIQQSLPEYRKARLPESKQISIVGKAISRL